MTDIGPIPPPASRDAEEALLGSCLIDPDAVFELKGYLEPVHFYYEIHRQVYLALLTLAVKEEPIDIMTVTERLKHKKQLESVGGEAFLIGLINLVPTSVNVHAYARLVIDRAVRRGMIRAASQIANLAYGDEELDEAISTSTASLLDAFSVRPQETLAPVDAVLPRVLDSVEERMRRHQAGEDIQIPTGYGDLDRLVQLEPPDLVYMAARPGMGKTSLYLGLAVNFARAGYRTALFNWEMTAEQLVQRMIAQESEVSLTRIRRGELTEHEHELVLQATGELSLLPITISQDWSARPSAVEADCRRVQATKGLDIFMCDYVQLMEPDEHARGEKRHAQVGQVSRALKRMCGSLGVLGVAVSQLSRANEQRKDKRPNMSDLRESGSLEQDADHIWFIHNKGYYKKKMTPTSEVIVEKQRNGPTGVIDLIWRPEYTRFYTPRTVEPDLAMFPGWQPGGDGA